MFPRLAFARDARHGNTINITHMKAFYEKAIYPAVLQVVDPNSHHEWAITFGNEQFRAATSSGSVVFTSRSLIQSNLDPFFEAVHHFCDNTQELKWARQYFLQLQIQGCKASTKHDKVPPPQEDNSMDLDEDDRTADDVFETARSGALLKAIHPLDWNVMIAENWFVDIGTTIHYMDAGYSLFAKRQAHPLILGTLTGLNTTEATTMVQRGSRTGYYLDEIAHLGDTAGFRAEH
jgi:hypothetical protein